MTTERSRARRDTRTRSLDAAVQLLGTGGLRALTHGRVDERARLPAGSTSNHFRTRKALVDVVVSHLAHADLDQVLQALATGATEDVVEGLAVMLERASGPDRVSTSARLVLFLEGNHDKAIRAALDTNRAMLEDVLVQGFAQSGAPDARRAAHAVTAAYDGLLLHRIARHDTTYPRPVLALVVHAALS